MSLRGCWVGVGICGYHIGRRGSCCLWREGRQMQQRSFRQLTSAVRLRRNHDSNSLGLSSFRKWVPFARHFNLIFVFPLVRYHLESLLFCKIKGCISFQSINWSRKVGLVLRVLCAKYWMLDETFFDYFVFETESCYITQTGLKTVILLLLPPDTRTTGVCCCARRGMLNLTP